MYSMKGAGMALKPWVAFVLAGSLLLAGCGGGGGGSGGGTGGSSSGGASSSSSGGTSSSSSGGGSGTTGPMLSGVVHGGQSPLAGSTVTLYVAGAGGSATTVASARTDGSGAFSIAADCTAAPLTPTALVYVTARGGDAGAGDNGAIALESALGQCRSLPASVNIDEVSTVASAYALSAFHGTSGISGKSPGLDNAFATVASLVNVAAGGAAATLPDAAACAAKPAPANCLAIERLDTVAQDLELVQERARLLQEEIAGQLSEATNRNLYMLSIVTTVMLPITLITGVFGMNVGGLPWLQDNLGFWNVMLLMGGTAVATLLVLHWKKLF
mgnify:CR=1 FL=1